MPPPWYGTDAVKGPSGVVGVAGVRTWSDTTEAATLPRDDLDDVDDVRLGAIDTEPADPDDVDDVDDVRLGAIDMALCAAATGVVWGDPDADGAREGDGDTDACTSASDDAAAALFAFCAAAWSSGDAVAATTI